MKPEIMEMNGKYAGYKKYAGDKLTRLKLTKIKIEDIRKIGNKYSHALKRKGTIGRINICMYVPSHGTPKTGPMTNIGEDVELWKEGTYSAGQFWDESGYDEDTVIPYCYINIFTPRESPTGGKGKTSTDKLCFYKCIKHVLLSSSKASDLKSGKKFMKRFKLTVDDPIDISLIPVIEKTTGISISVIGDHTYTSTYNADKRVLLNLTNGHYTLIKKQNIKLSFSKFERKPIIISSINKRYLGYDGKEFIEVEYNTYFKNRFNTECEFVYIWLTIKKKEQHQYEEHYIKAYNDFVKTADELKKQSKGYINLYKTGSYKNTALKLIADTFQDYNYEFDDMDIDEDEWHIKCNRGGIIKHDYSEVKYEKLYGYDICSAYPSIMIKNNTIPYKRGEFKTVTNKEYEDKFYSKGIYRAVVQLGNPLFSYNRNNYYCDVELNSAKQMGLKVELIEDDKENYLCYSKEKCIKLSLLFEKVITMLFEMKQKGIEGAKLILCIIYGILSQKHKVNKIVSYTDTDTNIEYKIPDNCVIDTVKQIAENVCKLKFKQVNNLYDGPLPRGIVWITALCRKMIYDTIKNKDNMKHVKMILTDGIYTDEPIFDKISVLPKTKQLGDLVKEGYYKDIKIIKGQTHKNYEFVKY